MGGLTFYDFDYAQSTAKTPNVTITDLGSGNYQIQVSNTLTKSITAVLARYVNTAGGISSTAYPFSSSLTSTNTYSASAIDGYLPAGTFYLDVVFSTLGFADSSNTNKFSISTTAISTLTPPDAVTVSFGGQGTLTLTASGFITN